VMRCFVKKKKSPQESCKMCRPIDAGSLICSLGHFECDGHAAHKLGQRRHCRLTRPTGEWLLRDVQ